MCALGDFITAMYDTNPDTVYFQPASGVVIMITQCGSEYQGVFAQYNPGAGLGASLFMSFDGGYDSASSNCNMKVFIDNTNYLEIFGSQTTGWSGIQVAE